MRLLHFADIHIGMENYSKLDPQTGLSTRLQDFFKTFDFIVETAYKEEVDAVVFAGDAYKTRDPNPTQQRGFGQRIKEIAKKIPVVLVVGNHDTPNAEGRANTLDIYSALEIENVWVSRKPELLNVPTKSGNLQVVTLPWLHKNDYKSIGQTLNSLFDKLADNSPSIFLSHCEIVGASYGSEKGMAIANDVTIPLSQIQHPKLSYGALGHIHKHQILTKPGEKPLILYAGSPHRIDFGEEKEEKGIILVDILPAHSKLNEKSQDYIATYKFIPTGARQFQTITINLKGADPNPTQTVLDEIKKNEIEEKIVKIVINIPADCEEEIQMDKVKKALSKAHLIAGVSRNVERKTRQRLEGAQEVESLTPIQALQKYFETKKFSEEKVKLMEKYAAQLLDN